MGPKPKSKIPKRGDIFLVNLNPIAGHEQQGQRYVMIVSPDDFNMSFKGMVWACPITTGGNYSRDRGFAVSLVSTGGLADGVVLCNQIRTLDLPARGGKFIERARADVVSEVVDTLKTILEG